MQKLPAFALGCVLGAVLAMAPSCGPTANKCSPETCRGCCSKDGKCAIGDTVAACGTDGHICDVCAGFQGCFQNKCVDPSAVGGGSATGTGGGSTTGTGGGSGGSTTGTGGGTGVGGGTTTGTGGGSGTGGGTTGCGLTTCPAGCCTGSLCLSPTQQNDTQCGSGGFACLACTSGNTCQGAQCTGGASCNATNCATGCCSGNSCLLPAQQGNGACGTGGNACAACMGAQVCSMGACGTVATVGGPCLSTPQCASLGAGAYCKLKTSSMNATYQNGYCTVPCTSFGATCGGGQGVCVGGSTSIISVYGEGDMFCASTCPTPQMQSTCRNGYLCRPPPAGSVAGGYCWLDPVPPFDGGGFPDKLGNACTLDPTCQNPPGPDWGFCIKGTNSSGLPTGYTNGYCTAECTFDNTGAFCGSSGACFGFNDGMGGVIGLCLRTCTTPGGGRSAVRPGGAYVCRTGTRADGGTLGYLFPACDNAGAAACPTRTFCNAANGYCCDGGFCLN